MWGSLVFQSDSLATEFSHYSAFAVRRPDKSFTCLSVCPSFLHFASLSDHARTATKYETTFVIASAALSQLAYRTLNNGQWSAAGNTRSVQQRQPVGRA
jgi:hypothetical protein